MHRTRHSIHLLRRVVVLALERHAEEYPPPRLPVRPLALPRALAAHEAHRLPVPVAQQIERDAAGQLQHDALVVEMQVVMAEVGGDEVLGGGADARETGEQGRWLRQMGYLHQARARPPSASPHSRSALSAASCLCATRTTHATWNVFYAAVAMYPPRWALRPWGTEACVGTRLCACGVYVAWWLRKGRRPTVLTVTKSSP